jgi:acetyl-CoA carboxylase carboxyl transferase subunit alpha
MNYLDFEKPIAELEGKIQELRQLSGTDTDVDIGEEIHKLEAKADTLRKDVYAKLSPWQKTQVARHPNRPHFLNYIKALMSDFTVLSGDRLFAQDDAIVAGMARFRGRSVMVLGHEKGSDTQTRIKHNFGMARPEGYRKSIRLMNLAERYDMPVVTLVDTAGAYPGVGAEERGQSEAIARSTDRCLTLNVPIVSIIIGEGGSGGAVAIATADRVLMLEHSVYSVISPEGCASILWRDAAKAPDAAAAMRLTAQQLQDQSVIDEILPEPLGGAHRDPQSIIKRAGDAIETSLYELEAMSPEERRKARRAKFLAIGRKT